MRLLPDLADFRLHLLFRLLQLEIPVARDLFQERLDVPRVVFNREISAHCQRLIIQYPARCVLRER